MARTASRQLALFQGPELPRDNTSLMTCTISSHAETKPDSPAIVLDGKAISYQVLELQVRRAGRMLHAHGLQVGKRFAWCALNRPETIIFALAAMRSGFVMVPLNWRLAADELCYILTDCSAKLIFTDARFRDKFEGPFSINATIVEIEASAESDVLDPVNENLWGKPDMASLQLYTSGTTGRPKGVLLTELALSLARVMEDISKAFDDWSDAEVLLSPLPLFHIGGLSWAFCGLVHGGSVVLTNDLDAEHLIALSLSSHVTRAFMVPQLVKAFLGAMTNEERCCSRIRAIHYGAAPMDMALLKTTSAALPTQFLQYFGMTEMAGTITILAPEYHSPEQGHLLGSVGRALPGVTLSIRRRNSEIAEIDEPGEIWAKSPCAMLGYATDNQIDESIFVEGWYPTGDGGKLDAEGFLYLTDRISDMIVTGGENVYPVEIESALRQHPAVADCAVFGLPDELWGERVCAAIEVAPGHQTDPAQLSAFAKQRIAGFKVPKQFEFVSALPRTASGKVQRSKLRNERIPAEAQSAIIGSSVI